jgi:anti-sigma factor RsiW
VSENQVESQLSAMFDGELPAAECELLSRRIDRDQNLRSRWSRYALIGAAMRSEPVATARSGFASRVSAALAAAALEVLNPTPPSYVTPAGSAGAANILRTQLADYIVAHSAYSTPLLRRNVLSELITSEDAMGIVSPHTIAAGSDATRSASGASR